MAVSVNGPMKIRPVLSPMILVIMLGVFGYGAYRFPDSPLRPCRTHGYCNKFGAPKDAAEYAAFSQWQSTMFVVWPLGFLSLVLVNHKVK